MAFYEKINKNDLYSKKNYLSKYKVLIRKILKAKQLDHEISYNYKSKIINP